MNFRNKGSRLARSSVLVASVAAAMPSPANAVSLGGVVATMASDVLKPFWMLLLSGAFLLGLWLVATGFTSLRSAADGGRSGWGDGMMRVVFGVALVSLPDFLNMGIMSMFDTVMGYQATQSGNGVGDVVDCLSSTMADTSPVTCVARNVAVNLVPVANEVCFALFGLVGAFIVGHTFYSMATSHSSGQAQMPRGWFPILMLGFLMLNIPYLIYSLEGTLGISSATITGDGYVKNGDMLAYRVDGMGSVMVQYQDLVGYVFKILVMFGILSIWKGISYLRAHSSGSERGGMAPGLTHIVGGVLLANAKFSTCVVLTTFFGNGGGFCS